MLEPITFPQGGHIESTDTTDTTAREETEIEQVRESFHIIEQTLTVASRLSIHCALNSLK